MKTKFFMMVGLPGSGKSYFANKIAEKENATIVSSDAIRGELYGDESIQTDPEKVFSIVHSRIFALLKESKNCIFDATNISYKRRMGFLHDIARFDCEKVCVVVWASFEECLARNSDRERVVPDYIIRRMYRNFDVPYWYEGWDEIQVEMNTEEKNSFFNLYCEPYLNMNQDNPRHTLPLGEHQEETRTHLVNTTHDYVLVVAGSIHDCGKPFTKSFFNSKGELTEVAHYYGHQNVGSYLALYLFRYKNYLLNSDDVLEISALTRWHMDPYFYKDNSKLEEKRKNLWGEELYNKITLLHEADECAH